MIFILSLSATRGLEYLENCFIDDVESNIECLIRCFEEGEVNWSVPKKATPGDIALFYCSKTSGSKLSSAALHMPDDYSQEFRDFVYDQIQKYKKYSGYILGYGIVASDPEYVEEDDRNYADINCLYRFEKPILFDDFKSFISINQQFYTYLKDDQWEKLKCLINRNNPSIFQKELLQDFEKLQLIFDNDVKNASKKTISQLEAEARENASKPVVSVVRTKAYNRSPEIAAYVKKRADGYCQLCGTKAPFFDRNGDPYLENHHIVWLSKDGMDSIDNCVALCPNCHRKMHVLNDPNDIEKLKVAIQ